MTKLKKMLKSKKLTQIDLQKLIYANTGGFIMSKSHISRIVNGKIKNVMLETVTIIAEALEVTVDSINDFKDVKKTNDL